MQVDNKRSLASKEYWDELWLKIPQQLRQFDTGSFIDRRFCNLFDRFFKEDPKKCLIEIGCAYSKYLEYFCRKYGYKVSGLDYSDHGCKTTNHLLKKNGFEIGGRIYCRDIFQQNDDLEGKFDIVTSFGVIEHFHNPQGVVGLLKAFLKEGGVILTEIPNTSGFNFLLMKYINKRAYNVHYIIDRQKLSRIHSDCGLEILFCNYYGSLNYGVVDLGKANPLVKRFFNVIFGWQHRIFHRIFDLLHFYPETRYFSPYIVCVAKKLTP